MSVEKNVWDGLTYDMVKACIKKESNRNAEIFNEILENCGMPERIQITELTEEENDLVDRFSLLVERMRVNEDE